MQTLYTITFLIPAARLEEAFDYLPASAGLGLCVNETGTFHTDNVYRTLFFNRIKQPFCAALPANVVLNASLHDVILPLFNHPQYTITEKKPVVILIHESVNETIDEWAQEVFQRKTQAQGWGGLRFINFFKSPCGLEKDGVFSLAIQSAADVNDLFSTKAFDDILALAGKHFIVQVNDLPLLPFVQQAFAETERALRIKNPNVYDVYIKFARIEKELQDTREQLQVSHKQLENLKRYNAILKSEEQTRRILEFYHGEYEVLPLWYKRFGHILKVLMGKRSLKSLFDDKAKKTIP